MQTNSVFRWSSLVVVSVISVLCSGCEDLDRAAGNAPPKATTGTTVVAPTLLAPDTTLPKQSSTAKKESTPPADPNPPVAATDPNAPSTLQPGQENDPNIKKAEGTDGVKGSGYGGGIITEPVSQYFRLQNRIEFEIQIPKQMQIWKAINNRNPKDWDEFKKVILDECQIDLPELPPNCKYIYDPKKGELLVESPTAG